MRLAVAIFLLYIGLNRLVGAFREPKGSKLIYLVNAILIIGAGVALAIIKGLPFKIVGLFIIGYSIVEIVGFIFCKKNGNTRQVIKEATIVEETNNKEGRKLLK